MSSCKPTLRVYLCSTALVLAAAAVWGRLLLIQIVEHDEYTRLARGQQEENAELAAPRGRILDRNGQVLAASVDAQSLCINPRALPDPEMAAEVLSSLLGLDRQKLREHIYAARSRNRAFMWVKRWLSPEEVARLEGLKYDWVHFKTEPKRYYPKHELACHVVGAVNHAQKGYLGVELSFNQILEGKPGQIKLLQDVSQREVASELEVQPEPGQDIWLTLDERIQHITQTALRQAVLENQASGGSAVVMDVRTGEVLALANIPEFDPNEPVRSQEDLKARLNLAISAPYEPGSVFKIVTVSAGLETGGLTPETLIDCGSGAIHVNGRTIRDHHPYDILPVSDVLVKSSNVGAIQIGLRLGPRLLYEYARKFGFGEKTGIELPAESPGALASWTEWHPTTLPSVAMGHELLATTLQLARAGAVIASGGFLINPTIIKRSSPDANPRHQRVLSPQVTFQMQSLMEQVVLRGTGQRAHLDAYTAAGKTGTAQIYDRTVGRYVHRYHSSFVGFAPATNPVLVAAVTIYDTKLFGGVVAAPVFRTIMEASLKLLGIPPDLPWDELEQRDTSMTKKFSTSRQRSTNLELPEPAAISEAKLPQTLSSVLLGPVVPDFRGRTKREVLRLASQARVPVALIGSGKAVSQNPPPGAVLEPNETVEVFFNF